MMARPMPDEWAPPARRGEYPQTVHPRARWREYADGRWWRLHRVIDLGGRALPGAYRAAWMWAASNALHCEGYRDEPAGLLYLRFVPAISHHPTHRDMTTEEAPR